jgi:hypothetical protein
MKLKGFQHSMNAGTDWGCPAAASRPVSCKRPLIRFGSAVLPLADAAAPRW